MLINVSRLFRDFNGPHFVVYFSLLLFCLMLSMKLDGLVDLPYWVVFHPLFLWKLFAISGAFVGCIVYCRHPPSENDFVGKFDFRGMVFSSLEHLLLLIFEVMVCFKLQLNYPISWAITFVPLLSESILAMAICVWCIRRGRSFAFEIMFSANVLQFVFIALKLDEVVHWPWVIVFIPFWIVLCLSLIGVLYAIILAMLLIRSIDLLPEYRRQHVYSAIAYAFLVIPFLIFIILLSNRLDGDSRLSYLLICSPLYISLMCLLFMTCGSRGGNQWWFGVRKDFCTFLLDLCPCLSEYGNISYRFQGVADEPETNETEENVQNLHKPNSFKEMKPPVAFVSIENPD
ncbi:hypothetical protein D918_03396 [Trichuris suis]|nr:hypothetical protein D918_03396 [Trichuris suis]